MLDAQSLLLLIVGLVFGAGLTWFGLRAAAARARAELEDRAREISEFNARVARLEAQLEAEQQKYQALVELKDRMKEEFGTVATEIMEKSNRAFMQLADQRFETLREAAKGDLDSRKKEVEQMVKPVTETLKRFEVKIGEVEQQRTKGFSGLKAQLEQLVTAKDQLQNATRDLTGALRAPTVRGQWGEMQLRRAVEMAGMEKHVDFVEQETVQGSDGRLRPDLIINLPGERRIAVDSKVPMDHFLNAMNAGDDAGRKAGRKQHARAVRQHIKALGQKSYQDALGDTPDLVAMYMSDAVYTAAVMEDPSLVDEALQSSVVLTNPMTLIGLLKTVAHAWRQEQLAENARDISELGRELHERISILGSHFDDIRKGLVRVTEAYNKAVGSLESRVLVTGRRFEELGITSTREIEPGTPVDVTPRGLSAPEMVEGGADDQRDSAAASGGPDSRRAADESGQYE